MSIFIDMDFLGFDEMKQEIEKLSTEDELKNLNKKIIKQAAEIGKKEAKEEIKEKAYSKNPMKSGRKGNRTGKHAADSIPVKASTKDGNYSQTIGWEAGNTSPHFYMQFLEWGTGLHKPKKFMLEAAKTTYKELKNIAEKEYEKALQEKLGGQ